MTPIPIKEIKNILVIRLDEIGDFVLTTPLLRELKSHFPNAKITLVVRPLVLNLAENCPYLDEVLSFDPAQKKFIIPFLRSWQNFIFYAAKHFWKRSFDLTIVPRWDFDKTCSTAPLAFFSKAKYRISYSEKVSKQKEKINPGYHYFFTHVSEDAVLRHEVERNLGLLPFIGGKINKTNMELWPTTEEDEAAKKWLESVGYHKNALNIAWGIGASALRRLWPIEQCAELAQWLQKQYGARFILVGDNSEAVIAAPFERALGKDAINACGNFSLRQLYALFKQMHLYIGNDSGPMHMAAAADLPVIEISCHPVTGAVDNPQSPKRFSPWCQSHLILQPPKAVNPCHETCVAPAPHCIKLIELNSIQGSIETFIKTVLGKKSSLAL